MVNDSSVVFTPPDSLLLEAEGVTLQIGVRRLCEQLCFKLYAGDCLVILGPNGAGKTTLLQALAGICPPAAGCIRVCGQSYPDWGQRAAACLRGFLPQHPSEFFPMTVREAVLIGRHPHLERWRWEGAADWAQAQHALEKVGLAEWAQRDILTLSGGERQRVAIAALLVQAPRLFLLDEPLNHLDLHYQIAMLDLLHERTRHGCGVVMVLHDINLAARYANKIILLDGQGGIQTGESQSVLQAGVLSRIYGHPLESVVVGCGKGQPERRFFVPK